MVEPIRLSRQQLCGDPNVVWNAFVGLLAETESNQLTATQRAAQLVFLYESEVQNGGHLQFFENIGTGQIHDLVGALKRLGAACHANVLAVAGERWSEKDRLKIRSVEEYVGIAREGEFESLDRAFHECQPTLVDALEGYLRQHEPDFVVFAD